jgi:hypothetical protein
LRRAVHRRNEQYALTTVLHRSMQEEVSWLTNAGHTTHAVMPQAEGCWPWFSSYSCLASCCFRSLPDRCTHTSRDAYPSTTPPQSDPYPNPDNTESIDMSQFPREVPRPSIECHTERPCPPAQPAPLAPLYVNATPNISQALHCATGHQPSHAHCSIVA